MSESAATTKTVIVTSVYPGPLRGAVVFGKAADGGRHKFLANGGKLFRDPLEGEIWTFHGRMYSHPKYGEQMHVESGIIDRPSGKLITNFLVNNPAFTDVSIGEKKAERLWNKFGEELNSILAAGDVERLSFILTKETGAKLVEAWKGVAEEAEVISFMAHYGFDSRLANKVRRVWPQDTLRKMQDNPYRMLAFASWKKVDSMALSLGVAEDDTRRLVAAVEAVLYQRLVAKHTVTPRNAVIAGVLAVLRTRSRQKVQVALHHAQQEYAVATCEGGYQPLGAAVMEKVVATRLRSMLTLAQQPTLFSACLKPIIEETVERFEVKQGIHLNTEQKAAVEMAVSRPLSVLTGGAGVGKTTVLRVVHEVCERVGVAITQMALSGRAAQRMREASGRDASTIAKFLRSAGEGYRENTSGDSLFIIDEASMIDLPLMYSIVRVLPSNARLLLIGDPYQLPPIGFGLTFQILATSSRVPRVELVEVHRQALSTGIPQIAHQIRNGVVPDLPPFAGAATGVSFIDYPHDQIMDGIDAIMEYLEPLSDVQILGITKRGASGIRNINRTFHSIHSGSKKTLEGRELAEGDPIIYLVNDYKNELWNGSLGRVVDVQDNPANSGGNRLAQTLICDFEGTRREVTEEHFENVDLAYAITVHKAQGSQFGRVVIPIVESRLLDRTLIYTALTRGIKQVVFVGDRAAFDHAIKAAPRAHERMVGFSV